MRKSLVAIVIAASIPALFAPPPAVGQNVEGRVGKLESEMRAVQRKVFPGGAGTYLEPQIAPSDAPAGPGPGTPASGAFDDLSARIVSLEGQMVTLTGQIEQNQYRVRQLEEQFAAYRKATDARLASAASVPEPIDAPLAPPVSASRPAAARPIATAATPARTAQIAALQRPATDDAAEDAYLLGYRMWEAKLYPEAVAQLRTVVATHPTHRRASYAQNLIGRSYLDDGKPNLAATSFYENYKKMPDGERAPDSLYFLGAALVKLGKPADACKVYGELTDVYGAKLSAQRKGEVATGRAAAKCS